MKDDKNFDTSFLILFNLYTFIFFDSVEKNFILKQTLIFFVKSINADLVLETKVL